MQKAKKIISAILSLVGWYVFALGLHCASPITGGGGSGWEAIIVQSFVDINGNPLTGVRMRVFPVDYDPAAQASPTRIKPDSCESEPDGRYVIDSLVGGHYYNVLAEANGKYSYLDSVYVPIDSSVTITIDTLKEPGALHGVIWLSHDHHRKSLDSRNARILLMGTPLFFVPQDSCGNFEATDLAEGRYRVKIIETERQNMPVDTFFSIQAGVNDTLQDTIGLAEIWIKCIAFNADNAAWIGTNGGILRCDGDIIKSYTYHDGLPRNDVNDLAFDSKGILWVGTGDGLARFDGTHWTIMTVADGLPNNYIKTVEVDANDHIWVGTSMGIGRYDGSQWTMYTYPACLPFYSVKDLAVDSSGHIWAATAGGVTRFDRSTWHTYNDTTSPALPGSDYRYVTRVAAGKNDTVWINTNAGLAMFDGSKWDAMPAPEDYAIDAIALDNKSKLLAGYSKPDNVMLARFDCQMWRIRALDPLLKGYHVRAIAINQQGEIWVGTTGGITHFDGYSWNVIGKQRLIREF